MNQQPASFPNVRAKTRVWRSLNSQIGLRILSGVTLLGSVFLPPAALGTSSPVIPDTDFSPQPPAAPVQPNPASQPEVAPKQVVPSPPAKVSAPKIAPKPSLSNPNNEGSVQPKLAAPKIKFAPKTQPQSVIPRPDAPPQSIQGKNQYIDPTGYGGGKNAAHTAPGAVILTERSSGCQTIAQNGRLVGGNCGTTATKEAATKISQPLPPRRLTAVKAQNSSSSPAASQPPVSRQYQPLRWQSNSIAPQSVVSLQPIERQGIKIALAPLADYNRATSLYGVPTPQPNRTDLIFPVSVVAPITSAFGWRTHPISGQGRMHEGTDIGAPLGTPVLAAYAGEVAYANWMGGYGLMVILRHLDGTQESRYAHLSEVFVQPDDQVEQGTVIGRVGSTGYSTGPHLHFEWRHNTPQGWVSVDAGLHLEYALENMIRYLQTAQAQPQSDS